MITALLRELLHEPILSFDCCYLAIVGGSCCSAPGLVCEALPSFFLSRSPVRTSVPLETSQTRPALEF